MTTPVVAAPDPVVVWRPQSRPQEALLACPTQDAFMGGARGGGKTDSLLGDWAAHADRYGQHAHGILLRRTYPELEEIERRSREIYTPLGWTYNQTSKTWTAPSGSALKLRYLLRETDADNYQGASFTWMGIDEAGNWPTSRGIDKLWATLRSAHGVPCVRRCTGNPGGPGQSWIRQRYIDPHPDGWVPFTYVPNPLTPEHTIEAVFIPSTLDDNPLIASQGYEARIAAAAGDNQALWGAWRYGRWDVFVGQAYSEFRREWHIVAGKGPRDFPPGTTWFATMDWGYARGCYGLWAVDREGRLEMVYEFYDRFRHLHAEAAAIEIYEASRDWPRPDVIHGDSQMFAAIGTGETLAEEFRKGLAQCWGASTAPALIEARHPPGSRAVKKAMIHEWLAVGKIPGTRQPALNDRGALEPWAVPKLRFHDRCKNTIRVLQEIPLDPDNPEDVDPDYEDDHPHDTVGFAVASRPRPAVDDPGPRPREDRHPGIDRSTGLPLSDRHRGRPWGELAASAREAQRARVTMPRPHLTRKVDL